MKKIAALILIPLLLVMGTVSVSAKNHYDSHYDFYGKAGPTIIKKMYTEKIQNAEVANLIIPVFADVGNTGISDTRAITANENVKGTLAHLYSQYAEITGKSVLVRTVTQYASSPWNIFYRSDITKRHKPIIRPPDHIILTT